MIDDEIVAVIDLDGPTGGSPHMLMQCNGCGRFIDRLCSVCPAEATPAQGHDPIAYERYRARRRREDRLLAVRPGERINHEHLDGVS